MWKHEIGEVERGNRWNRGQGSDGGSCIDGARKVGNKNGKLKGKGASRL